MIHFTNPLLLWSLLGLAIPIGIHMLSRKEGKVIRLGSIRHVKETNTQQFKGIRLNEIVLLLIRCSLIVLFSLIISGLSLSDTSERRWLLLEKGLEDQSNLVASIDSLRDQGFEVRCLSDKFPLLKDSSSATTVPNYRSLIDQLSTENLKEVIVIALNNVNNFYGKRLSLPGNIRWISEPPRPTNFTLSVIQDLQDSMLLRKGHSDQTATYFTSVRTAKTPERPEATPPDKVSVVVMTDEKYKYDLSILRAALKGIEASIPVHFEITQLNPKDSLPSNSPDWIISLSNKAIPGTIISRVLTISPHDEREIIRQDAHNRWSITHRLNEEVALQKNLTLSLARLLIPSKEQTKAIVRANDRRMASDSIIWAPANDIQSQSIAGVRSESASAYLLPLMLILMMVERIVANQRNQ